MTPVTCTVITKLLFSVKGKSKGDHSSQRTIEIPVTGLSPHHTKYTPDLVRFLSEDHHMVPALRYARPNAMNKERKSL